MRDEYIYYVYMMQSSSRRAVYTTNNLRKRVWEHKNQIREGFTRRQSFPINQGDQSREAAKGLAPRKKDVVDLTKKSRLERIGSRLVPNRNASSLDYGARSLSVNEHPRSG
jgi:hypothetical protein